MKYKINYKKATKHILYRGIGINLKYTWTFMKDFFINLIWCQFCFMMMLFSILYLPFRFIYILIRTIFILIKYKFINNEEKINNLISRGFYIERKFINESNNKV